MSTLHTIHVPLAVHEVVAPSLPLPSFLPSLVTQRLRSNRVSYLQTRHGLDVATNRIDSSRIHPSIPSFRPNPTTPTYKPLLESIQTPYPQLPFSPVQYLTGAETVHLAAFRSRAQTSPVPYPAHPNRRRFKLSSRNEGSSLLDDMLRSFFWLILFVPAACDPPPRRFVRRRPGSSTMFAIHHRPAIPA